MRIVLDAMGSDTCPIPEVEAAVLAAKKWGDPVLLVGKEEELKPKLEALEPETGLVEIIHASEVFQMTDKPARTARQKASSSMAVGMDLLKEDKADAFVTAGNTGGALVNAIFRLGRIPGVKRPALAPTVPVANGTAIVIDVGANTDCKPEYLLQFARLGSLYAQKVHGIPEPRVGLLSNGEEEGKGNQLVKDTFPLLKESGLNFIGNLEPKEVFAGEADVVVTDGFYGNILIKSSEAVAKFLVELIKEQIQAGAITSLGGLLAKPAFKRVFSILDPSEYGGAPLLGVQGLVFVGHGRSDARALVSAIGEARKAVEHNLLAAMQSGIK
ncbi:MAG: phosphate acyltransferase PlsX [Anaerolineales bacterium]|nr:phosphate acyltransferase PlsX [Anaerolineales bacterium]